MADDDYAFALSLQEEFASSVENNDHKASYTKIKDSKTSVVDECWETIDPTPDIRQLFLQFNDMYFEGKLAGVEVRWSPRMTLCAGLCCYEGRGGLCSVRLSLPLLKLRPRRDLVQTLLHEMIHALLFVTCNNKDHDAHGPEFHKHMYRINKESGAHITVYHNFHDEVNLYKQHWWKCDGPCQKRRPYYGMVKRSMNRAPSPNDIWWAEHEQKCGGKYTKVKEPEDYGKKKKKTKDENGTREEKVPKNSGLVKIDDFLKKEKTEKLWQEDKSNTLTKNKENDMQNLNTNTIVPFSGKGFALGGSKIESSTITRPWLADIAFPDKDNTTNNKSNLKVLGQKSAESLNKLNDLNLGKLTRNKNNHVDAKKNDNNPLKKRKRSNNDITIIDAFKKVEKSVATIVIEDSPVKPVMVECPSCQTKIQENLINAHLDRCLL